MSVDSLMTLPVQIHMQSKLAESEDEHGNPVFPESSYKTRGHIGRQAATELDENSVHVESYLLVLPRDCPLTGWDRVEIAGTSYEVIGPPWGVWNPRKQQVSHVEVTVRRGTSDAN